MQNAEGGGVSARSENPNDGYRSIVPELVSSIAHIQASRSVIAMEPALSNQDVAADIGMLMASRPATRMRRLRRTLATCVLRYPFTSCSITKHHNMERVCRIRPQVGSLGRRRVSNAG